jgi:hypothetical protein
MRMGIERIGGKENKQKEGQTERRTGEEEVMRRKDRKTRGQYDDWRIGRQEGRMKGE